MPTPPPPQESTNLIPDWRSTTLWLAYALLSLLLAWAAGEWTAQREKRIQVEAIHQTIEVQALGLHGTVARYNRYLQDINSRVGSDTLYLMSARPLHPSWPVMPTAFSR